MPFKSAAQRRYLYAKHPQIARRWSAEEKAVNKSEPRYGTGGGGHGSRMTDDVSKSIGSALRTTGAELKSTFRPIHASAKTTPGGAPRPRMQQYQNRAVETLKTRPRAAATIGGSSLVGSYGAGSFGKAKAKASGPQQRPPKNAAELEEWKVKARGLSRQIRAGGRREDVGKRRREYEPEHRRQRRLGMYEAGLAGGGIGSAGYGAHLIRSDTKKLRESGIRTQTVNDQGKTVQGKDLKLGKTPVGRGTIKLSRRSGALVGGGLAALAGAGAVRHHAESSRGRVRG
jgi:hypothetical protein